jgi:hypothetical protein
MGYYDCWTYSTPCVVTVKAYWYTDSECKDSNPLVITLTETPGTTTIANLGEPGCYP